VTGHGGRLTAAFACSDEVGLAAGPALEAASVGTAQTLTVARAGAGAEWRAGGSSVRSPLVEVCVAGVDGCRGGWLVVAAVVAPFEVAPFEVVGCEVVVDSGAIIGRADLTMVAVDMPIGLPFDGSPRVADVEARRRLGPRRSSVFPTPARAVLGARSFEDALVRSRATTGRGCRSRRGTWCRRSPRSTRS
jgi:hypothetical protein